MIALAVDDEYLMLNMLVQALKASPDIKEIHDFSDCNEAKEWILNNHVDIAFLDIHMRGMSGLELAQNLQKVQPNCKIIFCTGYSEYAIDAFKIHVSGYVMKPVTYQDIQTEIDHIKQSKPKESLLAAKCFGNFEILYNNEPLRFKRSKTKELLAYLIDRNGAGVTAKQICAVLWESDLSETKQMNYFWQLLDDLRHTLREVDSENLLLKSGKNYSIDVNMLDCDYIQYLKTGTPVFHGEYMTQYSWAESTTGYLYGQTV